MALNYENLDSRTCKFMLEEVDLDSSRGTLYISPRLNAEGREKYESLLREAVQSRDDAWLASELRYRSCMNTTEQRRKPKGGFTTVQVPITAPDTLAEGEFNRFYVRGLCRRAIEDNITEVVICRGKQVSQPRPESEAMMGKRISARDLLEDLRESQGVEPALGLPPGPNSGLTVRLPLTISSPAGTETLAGTIDLHRKRCSGSMLSRQSLHS